MKLNVANHVMLSTDYYSMRLSELPLSLLIPLLSNHLVDEPVEGNHRVCDLLGGMLARWEELTGTPHDADEVFAFILEKYQPLHGNQPLTKDAAGPYLVKELATGGLYGQPPPPRKSG